MHGPKRADFSFAPWKRGSGDALTSAPLWTLLALQCFTQHGLGNGPKGSQGLIPFPPLLLARELCLLLRRLLLDPVVSGEYTIIFLLLLTAIVIIIIIKMLSSSLTT